MKRVAVTGHGGAGAYAPQNSAASFEHAVAFGVDRIEFDLFFHEGEWWFAHDAQALEHAPHLTAHRGLQILARSRIPLCCDVKSWGREQEIATRLYVHGLLDRTLVCGHSIEHLREIQRLAPRLTIGWSVPENKDTLDRTEPVGEAGSRGWKYRLPGLAHERVARGECNGLMVHKDLVSAALCRMVHSAGGFINAWTVDDGEEAIRLAKLGVDGITTNDPPLIIAALESIDAR